MKRIYFLLLAAFCSVMAFAQEATTTNVDVNLKGDGGGGFPWLWVVGGLVFVVLLVSLLSGRGSDRVVHKKTIIKE